MLLHAATNQHGWVQMPFVCKMYMGGEGNDIPRHYEKFLKRSVEADFISKDLYLRIFFENGEKTDGKIQQDDLMRLFNRFKQQCKFRNSLKRLVRKARMTRLKKELVEKVFEPQRVQKWLDAGLDPSDM